MENRRRGPGCPDLACSRATRDWDAALGALPQLVFLLDERGRIVRANRAVERWALGPVQNALGRELHELLHPGCDDPACYLGGLWHEARKDLAEGRHAQWEASDGVLNRHLHVQVHAPLYEEEWQGGMPAGFAVAVMHDLSELNRAKHALKRLNRELERRVEERTAELREANEHLTWEIEERQRAEERLRESESELRLLSAQLMKAQEMERKRIASELHDGIGQSLSAVKFCVEDALRLVAEGRAGEGIRLLEGLTPRIQGAIEEVRKISMALRPSTLDDLGLLPTLAWFFREFQSVYRDLHLEKQIGIREEDIAGCLKTVVFRVLQEALNNVAKHAQADSVRVSLGIAGDIIELLVQDNGRGFDTAEVGSREKIGRGFGLASMRERTEFSGGSFSIESAGGQGTRIRARWPAGVCAEGPVHGFKP